MSPSPLLCADAFEWTPVASLIVCPQGRIQHVNQAGIRITGRGPDKLVGQRLAALLGGTDPARIEGFLNGLFAGGASASITAELAGDDTPRPVRVDAAVSPDRQACYATLQDIVGDWQALRDSKARWKYAIEGSGEGVWDWDLATGTVFFSTRLKELLGYSENDMDSTTQAWAMLVHPDDLNAARVEMAKHLEGHTKSYQCEYRMHSKDGSYRWILSRGVVVQYDQADKPLRVVGTHADVTERKQIELNLMAAREDLADTLNAIPDLLFEMGLDGRYYDYRTSNTELLVAPRDILIGRLVTEILPEMASSVRLQALREAHERGVSKGLRYSLPFGDERKWFELTVARKARHFEDGPRFIVIARDITRQKLLEDELLIGAKAFESQHAMFLADPHRIVMRVNRAMCQLTGYEAKEMVGINTAALTPAELVPQHTRDHFWAMMATEGTCSEELTARRKDGSTITVWFTMNVVKNDRGDVTHYVGTATDITERKRRRDESEAQAIVHRNALVREVHHRIKNNLQGIVGILREFARHHPETTKPIAEAVGQVQSIAVIHGLQGQASRDEVYLCELTEAVAGNVGALWQTAVDVDIPPFWQPCRVPQSEAVPLALIINELILNAVKHSDTSKANVSITLRKNGGPDKVRICITNRGLWQPNQHARHVGLDLVDTLMPRHGAQLGRVQQDGHVTTFFDLGPPVISRSDSNSTPSAA